MITALLIFGLSALAIIMIVQQYEASEENKPIMIKTKSSVIKKQKPKMKSIRKKYR